MRILLFTGKGGVGKTTAAAATAFATARQGLKTLVISTDPAHSLADSLSVTLAPEPVLIAENLWAQELDAYYSMKKYWGHMRDLLLTVFKWKGVKNIVAEEISLLPGMEEGAAFLWIEKFYSEGEYDVIVIDAAPTGETLTLLSLPQVVQSWMMKAFPGQKLAMKTIGSMVRRTTGVPLDKGYEEMEAIFDKLERIQKVLLNPAICSIRIVANPERMVIQEAKRAYTYLQLYGYNVDAVIVNRILPEAEIHEGDWFAKYVKAQEAHLRDIEDSFTGMPILRVPHLGEEVFGEPMLNKIADALYKDHSAAEVLFREQPFVVTATHDGYDIALKLPFIGKENFKVRKYGDELVIDLGNRRRSAFLPRFAQVMEMEDYNYESPWLHISLVR